MKKKIILFFLICSCTVANSQTFNNRYIIDQTAIRFRNIVQSEDTIITVGIGTTFEAPFPPKLMFTRFDQEGNVLSYDFLLADSLTKYDAIASDVKNKKVLVAGGAGIIKTNESGFYAMYDINNGLDWLKQYIPPDNWVTFFVSCLFLEDKMYMLALQQNHNISDIIFSKLICFDTQGDVLWEKQFAENNKNIRPGVITLSQDSTIYLGLQRKNYPSMQGDNSAQSLIYKLDLDGNILDIWENDEVNTFMPEQIIEVGDTSLLFVGRYIAGYSPNDVTLFNGNICKVDALTNRDWSLKTGKITAATDMNNFIPTMDGNYIAIGVTLDSLSSSQTLTESGHIVKFNIDGEMIWERRHFGVEANGEDNKPYDIVELADSSLVICGESIDFFEDFPNRGWLLKLDQYGCLIPGCHLLDFTSDLPDKTFEVLLYPNPASEQLNIYISEHLKNGNATIIDLSGNVISQFDVQGNNATYIYDVSGLATGIYFLKIQDEEGRILTKEFVVQP